MRALLLISLICSVSFADASVFEDAWWTIDDFVPINNFWNDVEDIQLRDWLFLLLLLPVSLWAAKQIGIDKTIASVWQGIARAGRACSRAYHNAVKWVAGTTDSPWMALFPRVTAGFILVVIVVIAVGIGQAYEDSRKPPGTHTPKQWELDVLADLAKKH